ncbi:MAG: hypothetical protein J6N19_13625 [Clostridium sp.]|nr:hypothetical protein [Clostridium sp.]
MAKSTRPTNTGTVGIKGTSTSGGTTRKKDQETYSNDLFIDTYIKSRLAGSTPQEAGDHAYWATGGEGSYNAPRANPQSEISEGIASGNYYQQNGRTFLTEDASKRYADRVKATQAQNDWANRNETVKTNPERDSLLEEYRRLANTTTNAIPIVQRRNEIRKRLDELDVELGNGIRDYTLSDKTQSVVGGAIKDYGSGIMNYVGSRLSVMGDTSAPMNPYLLRAQGMNNAEISQAMEQAATQNPNRGDRLRAAGSRVEEIAASISDDAQKDLTRAKNGLGNLGQAGVDIATNMIQMGFDAALGVITGGSALIPMYTRSAGSSYAKARGEGASTTEAVLYSAASGGIEVFTEKMADGLAGIYGAGAADVFTERMIRKLTKSDLGRSFLRLVVGAGEEGIEEVVSDLLAPYAETIYDGNSPLSVFQNTFKGTYDPSDLLYDFVIGAAVGLVCGGIGAATGSNSRPNQNARYADQAESALREQGVSGRQATRVGEIIANQAMGEDLTGREQRLLDRTQGAQEIAKGIQNQEQSYVQSIMQAENQQREAEQREATQQSRVSRYLERVRAGEVDQTGTADTKGATIQYEGRQAKVDFVRDGDQNRVRLTFEDGTERTVSYQEAADAGLDENVQNLMVALSAIGPNAPAAYSVYESDQEVGRYAAAMDEAINLYAAQGQDVRKAAAAARDSNSPAMITYLTDAQLELAQSLGSKIYEQKQAQVKEAGAKLAEIRQAAQEAMSAQDVTATEGLAAVNATLTDARQHLKSVQQAFNDTMEYLDEMAANGQEGTEAYKNALEQANALRDDLDGTQKVIEALEGERKNLQAQQPIKRKQGTVSFAGGTINGEKVNGVDRSKLNRQQKNVVAMVEALADAVNVDYVFFDGDAKGNQGAYVQGGTVYINVNAGMAANKALAAATLSHELTHYTQEYAPEEYEQLKQFIISNVLQKGELDRLVQQQLRLEPNLSYDQALDEVVANACQTMLQDSKAIAKLARQNMTLAEKIADYIEDITARLKAAFEDVNYQDNLPLYNAVKAMEDQLDEMQRLWDAGIEAATENYNAQNTVRNAREKAENAQETQNVPEIAGEMPAAAQRADTQNQQWDEEEAPVRQEISSAATSINANKMPVLYTNKNAVFPEGGTNIDIGGGRFDNVTEYLADKGVTNLLFDPYNRPEETNTATLQFLQDGKPRRIVYPEEALAYILPDNADQDVVDQLNQRGYNVLTYKAGDEADRLEKLNSVEKAKFQRWDSGQTNLFGDETSEQISLDDWVNNRQETNRDLHPRLQKMLDDAAALEERVREFFRSVPEDSQYYLDSDQIDSMMEVDLYGSDGDMHSADDIIDNLSNLAKNMRGSNRENAYELMDALLQHLSVVQQDRWIEQPGAHDSAFAEWYSRKHPSLYYPGYEMGKLNVGKEVDYLRELIDSGTLTAEDQAEAQRLYDAMRSSPYSTWYQKWDDTSDDTASEDAGRRMAYAMIQAENNALKDAIAGLNKLTNKQNTTIAKLEQKLRLTKTPEVRQSDANRLARQLVKDHSSTADAARVAAELKALGDYILQNKEIDADVVKQRARAIAAEIVQNAETTVDYGGELAMYRNITSDIKGKKLTIDEDFLGELDAVDGYDAFRKRNFANFTLAKRETGDSAGREGYTTVGSYYSTLQQQYGEAYFPEVANEGEQIQIIADMFQRAKGITVNPNVDYMGEATEELANRIAFDVMDGIMRPTPPTQADRQKARTDALRQQIKDLQKEGALSEKEADMLRKTVYDLTLALDNAESRYKTLQVTSDERFRQIQAEGKERAVEAKLRERARQEEKIAALKDHYQEMADRARDRRENTHTRHKIRKLVDRLNKMLKSPTEKRHIPRELVKETIAVLEMIDLDTGRSANITVQLAKIRQMYEGYKNNPTYAVGYDETVDEMLSNLQQTIGETPLHKMTAEQLEAVYSTLRALNHVISTAVQVQIGEQERNAFELAESMTAETRDIPKAQKGWLRSHYLPAHLRADVMFNRLGGHKKNSVWSQIARMLNDGQLKQTMIKMQLSTPFASLVNDERALQDFTGTDKRGRIDQKKLADIGLKDKDGNTIKVTHGIMVGIYMDLLNEQNRRHLIRGGKTIPNLNDYYSGKGGFGTGTVRAVGIATELSDLYHQMNEAKEDGDTDLVQELEDRIEEVQLSSETYADTMQKSIESQMTAFDRKWVAAIQQLMDVDSKAFLNATTMEVYGIEKASVDNYYPITSDPSFLSTPFESITKDMNLENVGFMKERVLNASNPTLAMDVSDVVNNQINRVAQYCGLMPAIRNFNKVYNKTEGGYNDSLKNAINDVFGKEGREYIENLMADLTGSRRSGEDSLGLSRMFAGLRGNLAQTTLTLNPRVALAQAASYPTAAAELGWGPLVRAFAHGGKNGRMISRADAQLIAEYSPLLWYRMQGYSQQELADATNRNDYVGRLWKKMRWATGWIQAVDGATVGRLWYAAEYWVDANKPDLKKGTDAYYQEVAKKFNDVVEKTQPNYTTMQRADILRSPKDLTKALTMFMTQRLQNFNIIYDSTASYQKARADFASGRNGVTATDVKEAKTQMVQAVTSQLAQAAVFTAFKMFADALLHNMNGYRDDETGDLTPESVALQLLRNYIDAIVGTVFLGSEIYSLIKVFTAGDSWYGLSVNGVDSVNDLVDDTVNLLKTDVDTSTEKGRAKLRNNILKVAQSWAQFLGIPFRNAVKMVSSIRYHIEDIKNGEFLSFEAGYERTKKQIAFKENIQPVGISGKQYEKILKQMNTDKSSGVTQAEAYTYLSEEYAKGKLSKEQVDGIWNAQGWSKGYDEYAETAKKAAEKEAEKNRNIEAAGVTREQYEEQLQKYGSEFVNDYYAAYRSTGLTIEQYETYKTGYAKCKGTDLDGDGKTDSGSKKAQVLQVIDSLPVSDTVKDALYEKNGWSMRTINEAPWHNSTRGMPSLEELLELNENPDRYDVGDTTVTAAEILAETLDRGQQITRVGETYQLIPGEYPSRKLYGEWLPVLNELGIDPGDVWENGQNVTLSQMSQYYTPEEYRERIEYMRQNRWWIDLGFEEEPAYAANELYLGWQENPDYPGQSFEEYLNTPESQSWLQQLAQTQSETAGGEWDRFTGGTARTYRGTGQKARRSGEALYVSRAMRDSKRGRR